MDERTGGGVAAGERGDPSPGVAMDVYHKPYQVLSKVAGTSYKLYSLLMQLLILKPLPLNHSYIPGTKSTGLG